MGWMNDESMKLWDTLEWRDSPSRFLADFDAMLDGIREVTKFEADYGKFLDGSSTLAVASVAMAAHFADLLQACSSVYGLPVAVERIRKAVDLFEEDLLRQQASRSSLKPVDRSDEASTPCDRAWQLIRSELEVVQEWVRVCSLPSEKQESETLSLVTYKEIADALSRAGHHILEGSVANRCRKEFGKPDGRKSRKNAFDSGRITPILRVFFGVEPKFTNE